MPFRAISGPHTRKKINLGTERPEQVLPKVNSESL
nr:MAG TPA: hypothetical protein [Caudoviricetes sp.]